MRPKDWLGGSVGGGLCIGAGRQLRGDHGTLSAGDYDTGDRRCVVMESNGIVWDLEMDRDKMEWNCFFLGGGGMYCGSGM